MDAGCQRYMYCQRCFQFSKFSGADPTTPARRQKCLSSSNVHPQKDMEAKNIPPNIKTFTWRLIRRALATGERAGKHSNKISKNCTTCGLLENDSHLFFHCTFPRAVWFSANPSLYTSALPHEQDGVQEILSQLLHDRITDEQMLTFLTTLWYIWRARNDHRFNNKKWTVFQVHNAVKADIAATSQCFQQYGEQVQLDNEAQTTRHEDQLRNQGINLSIADRLAQPSLDRSRRIPPLSIAPRPASPFFRADFPALLLGTRIYTDASCAPDMRHQVSRCWNSVF